MGQILYVDVLVVINIYINYGLLLLTALAGHQKQNRLRIILSALAGGFYSLIIIIPNISEFIITLSRIPALVIMVLIAFGFKSRRIFVRLLFTFLGVNFAFAGIMFAVWYLIAPNNMYFSSGVVYFDIDTLTLVTLTIICYLIIKLLDRVLRTRAPINTIYSLELSVLGQKVSCRAFYDTGNSLSDPFSGEGVIVVSEDVIKGKIPFDIYASDEVTLKELKIRFIPCTSLGGDGLLPTFRADYAKVKGISCDFEIDSPIIAVSKRKIRGGDFGALLYGTIFDNNISENGEDYVLQP